MAMKTKRLPPPADRPPLLVGLFGGDRFAVAPYPPGTPADVADIAPAQHAAAVAGLLLAVADPAGLLPDDLLVRVVPPRPAGDWLSHPDDGLTELLGVIAGRRPTL